MELTITFFDNYGFRGCFFNVHFAIRDGKNQSANLLGLFCEFYNRGYVFRSSGRHIWLKLYRSDEVPDGVFHANYTVKQLNFTGIMMMIIIFTDHFFFYITHFRWLIVYK